MIVPVAGTTRKVVIAIFANLWIEMGSNVSGLTNWTMLDGFCSLPLNNLNEMTNHSVTRMNTDR